jgi:hypothetical protein
MDALLNRSRRPAERPLGAEVVKTLRIVIPAMRRSHGLFVTAVELVQYDSFERIEFALPRGFLK